MKILLVLMFILTSTGAVETEDRVESHRKQKQNSIYSIPLKKNILEREPTTIPEFEYTRDTIALIDENFESGMPVDWIVIDGNSDGYTWTTGTYYLLYYHPPNYGATYAYYADNDAGSGAPAGTEYLISPPTGCAGATSMSLSYGWGHNQMTLYAYGTSQIRLHNGASWGSWNTLATFAYTTNGGDNFNLDSYLPAESVQVQFTYEDLYGEWGLAFGIDNVLLEAYIPTFYVWDFENGVQGWTHTSGQTFPASWRVTNTSYMVGSYNIAPPAAGDSCMCIDSDGSGTGVWVHDSAMSPPVPHLGYAWWLWGFNYQNYSGHDTVFVIARIHNGASWQPWTEIRRYNTDLVQIWDSTVVSNPTAESIQVGYVYNDYNLRCYFAAFDNVGLYRFPEHDIACMAIVSPPEGFVTSGNYDVTGQIHNFGSNEETVFVYAEVYDTVSMTQIFTQTLLVPDFPIGGDSNVVLGQVTLHQDGSFLTQISASCSGDENPSNDTISIYSWTMGFLGEVIFEMDIESACGDNQCIGVEFDGTYFYITGANNATDPNKVYVVDTSGNLIWALDQPAHCTGWGWRDLCWDDVYAGPDRIDTLYASVDPNIDYFGIDLTAGVLSYYHFSPGAQNPNRALAYQPDSGWFFTANFTSDCYRFKKAGLPVSVPNTLAMYGATYDSDPTYGGWVWWHSQDDPGTGFPCQITQMDAVAMDFTGFYSGYELPSGLTDGVAGGLCFYEGFRGADVLFAIIQGTPRDYLIGIALRDDSTGIAQNPAIVQPRAFGFSQSLPLFIHKSMTIDFTTNVSGPTSLKIYDIMGRHVRTLFEDFTEAGEKSITWDGKNDRQQNVANGIYILQLQAENRNDIGKIVVIR